ncbi:uncharacterized protein LOC131928356 [Physella acuta]|uniref:uncharacterized protein LOC131928356 n=1 Tax=Physella acuta TaxID=109671 RepID=UPI0027DBEF8D|nr:uncharacterized protein LOC131928356 [Physella acuta]
MTMMRLLVFFYLTLRGVSSVKHTGSLAFCPAGFSPIGDHCFKFAGYASHRNAIKMCQVSNSVLFEIPFWKEQKEMEQFLREKKIDNPVWLNGYLSRLAFRDRSVSFYWKSTYHPQVTNFKEDRCPDFAGQMMCVFINPKEDFIWDCASCFSEYIAVVCTKRRGKKTQPITTTVAPVPDVIL